MSIEQNPSASDCLGDPRLSGREYGSAGALQRLGGSLAPPLRRSGFSLIEMVGVLSVIALLVTALAPSLIKRLDFEAKVSEQEKIRQLRESLLNATLVDRRIPVASSFAATIATNLGNNLSEVGTNARYFPRLFIADPALNINGNMLPYTQTQSGSTNWPVNGRAMIISTVAKVLPAINPNASEFDTIWNTVEDTVPGPLSSWGGRAEDLVIERINFATMFYKVVLMNGDPSPDAYPNRGIYSIDTNSATWIAPQASYVRYYMDGTVINLYHPDGTLDTREILHSDVSFLYKKNRWGRRLGGSDEVIGGFGELVAEFLEPPAPPDPKFAATQQAVVNALYSFLWGFSVWANGDMKTNYTYAGVPVFPAVPTFAGAGGSGAPNYPSYSQAAEAQVQLENFTSNLIE